MKENKEKQPEKQNPLSAYKHSSHPDRHVVEALEHLEARVAALEGKGKKKEPDTE